MDVRYLVVHTAAFSGANCDAAMIDRWHRDKGWNGIGYHYVILNDRHDSKADGLLEHGRPTTVNGAHCLGINGRSLGICMVGHGDREAFTDSQSSTLDSLLRELMAKHRVTADAVIGHREINDLIAQGLVDAQYHTSKSCPGNQIDMNALRASLQTPRAGEATPHTIESIDGAERERLQKAFADIEASLDKFPNARDEYRELRHHPEVIEAIGSEA